MLLNEVSPQQLFSCFYWIFFKLLGTVKSWKYFHLKEILFWFLRPAKNLSLDYGRIYGVKDFRNQNITRSAWNEPGNSLESLLRRVHINLQSATLLFCLPADVAETGRYWKFWSAIAKFLKCAFSESHYLLLMLSWVTPSWKIKAHMAPSCSEFGSGSEY